MSDIETLVQALRNAAAREDRGITVIAEDEMAPKQRHSYRELDEQAQKLARGLVENGVKKGDRVLLVLSGAEFVVSFFGTLYAGAIPVPSYPPAMMERVEASLSRIGYQARHSGAVLCITSASHRSLLGGLAYDCPELREIRVADTLFSSNGDIALPEPSTSDTAFIQYTSGSTGDPRGVVVTHANACANIRGLGLAVEVTDDDSFVSWLPLYHDMGLVCAMLFSVYHAIPITLMTPATFLSRPGRWLRAISDARATITASPNFGYGLCTRRVSEEERAGLDLSSLRVCINGAETVNVRTVDAFNRMYAENGLRDDAMLPAYGMAECVVAAAFPKPGRTLRTIKVDRDALANGNVALSDAPEAAEIVAHGRPIHGHALMIVDEEGTPLGQDKVGHILFTGPSLMKGYYEDNAATFTAIAGGWLRTGDLGFFHDGELYLSGRAKDIIIVRGKNYCAEDIEQIVERVPGVRLGGCVAFGVYDDERAVDRVVVVCETRSENDLERGTIKETVARAVGDACGLSVDEVVLVPPSTIPKTSSGKRQRRLTRARYLEGTLSRRLTRTSKVRLALVLARSGAGFLAMLRRRIAA